MVERRARFPITGCSQHCVDEMTHPSLPFWQHCGSVEIDHAAEQLIAGDYGLICYARSNNVKVPNVAFAASSASLQEGSIILKSRDSKALVDEKGS